MYLPLSVVLQVPVIQGRSKMILNVSCQIKFSHDAVQSLLTLQSLACPETTRVITH